MEMEAMMTGKLSPEGEVHRSVRRCLGRSIPSAHQLPWKRATRFLPGQFPDALGVYMGMVEE